MPIACDIINVYANTKNTFFTERINFMILLDELRLELVGCRKEMEELADVLSIKASKERIEELNAETAKDGFWDDLENSQKVLQETKSLERKIEKFNKLNGQLEDVITLIELSIEEEDESSIEEIKAEAEDFKKKLEEVGAKVELQ